MQHTSTDSDVNPKDSLFFKSKTYFGFLPHHRTRWGWLANKRNCWRIKSNDEVYQALKDLHHPVVCVPPGRGTAVGNLYRIGAEVHVLTDRQLHRLVQMHGSDGEALARGLLSHLEPGGGGVTYA